MIGKLKVRFVFAGEAFDTFLGSASNAGAEFNDGSIFFRRKRNGKEERTPMIARMWRGVTLAQKTEQYLEYLMETGLKDCRAVPGNRGVQVLHRTYEGKTEFLLLSLWESYAAIRAFAGDDLEQAVYYPKDEEFLLELEPTVMHYEAATTL
jgi:heme-degrading monooxygenase HmoA